MIERLQNYAMKITTPRRQPPWPKSLT